MLGQMLADGLFLILAELDFGGIEESEVVHECSPEEVASHAMTEL